MTRLSISLAIASLTLSLAPSVQAYGQQPEAAQAHISVVTQINAMFQSAQEPQTAQCSVAFAPDLFAILGLEKPQQSTAAQSVAMACLQQ